MKKSIKFDVNGKPPQKSEWSENKTAIQIINLRETALKARTKAGMNKCFTSPVKMKLTVYAPNIDKQEYKQKGDDDENRYVGDLDNLVAGICDCLGASKTKPGENNFAPSKLFDDKPEIRPEIPIIIQDDSQIVSIRAKKKQSSKLHYIVQIRLD